MTQAPAAVSDRFTVECPLGAGAFGSVFQVWDREREERVALKRLERVDPSSIYRFKQEFRALTDLSHPNLVRLHELFALDDGWCFTMDLVRGVRFDNWARGQERDPESVSDVGPLSRARRTTVETSIEVPEPGGESASLAPSVAPPPFDPERVRQSVRQLFDGVLTLHRAGILHRDIKPSNVLVEANGRVVILDFGLAATGVVEAHLSIDGVVAGTPAYMAPEQARGAPLTGACDFYAIGAMLYEVLCGHVPFDGPLNAMLAARIAGEIEDPRRKVEGLPDDLCELSVALLRRDPAARPGAAELSQRLALDAPVHVSQRPSGAEDLIGRQRERETLDQALELTRGGHAVVALVHGAGGYGKTALIQSFLADLERRRGVVVLRGRCYERESMPYKAFDELVDALGKYLRSMRPVEAAALMPRDAPALLRLFPALGRLEVLQTLPGRAVTGDAHELRRRAFGALREIFARITDARPLVLFIDDAQWGDADSAALVRHVLAPPEAPPLLLIAAYRGDAANNDLLRVVRTPEAVDAGWHGVDLALGPLSAGDAESLARHLLGAQAPQGARPDAIASESGGSPLFVQELVQAATRTGGADGEISLRKLAERRLSALQNDARSTLELLACSERPLAENELRSASGFEAQRLHAVVDQLRASGLVQLSTGSEAGATSIGHAELRRAIRDGIEPERSRQHHENLARALERSDPPDADALAYHHEAAGNAEKARVWGERAGDRAAQGMAFDRAISLYRQAVTQATGIDYRRITQKLASALSGAGRSAEAAESFLIVSAELEGDASLELRQRAALLYLRAGHVAQAFEAFGPLLSESDLSIPKTPERALVSLLLRRAKLKLRGLGFKERSLEDVPAESLRRIDLAWSLGGGLAGIDLVRSAHYHTLCLLRALDAGEPVRVVRSLALHAVMKSLESAEGVERAAEIAARSQTIAERIAQPTALGWAAAAKTVVAWGSVRLADCVRHADEAALLLREQAEDNYREIGSLEVWFALHSLFLLGDLKRFAERAPALAREADARGDRYTLSTVRAYDLPLLFLAQDRPAEARHEADTAIANWPEDAWYHQHWARLRALCLLDLYEGAGARLLERVARHRADMKRSLQLRLRTLRIEFGYLEGRGLLARAHAEPASRSSASGVRALISGLLAEKSGLGTAYARSLEAGLASLSNAELGAAAFLEAKHAFEAMSMPMHAAAADRRRGECLGGEEGQRLIAACDVLLAEHGVANPTRFADLLQPSVPPT